MKFDITDNYSIEMLDLFFDAYSQDVIRIPVIASDGHNYDAIELLKAFTHGIPGSLKVGINTTLKKEAINFNFGLYCQIRDFFQDLLNKDQDQLSNPIYKEARIIIERHAASIEKDHELITELITLCEENNIEINGFFINLNIKNDKFNTKPPVNESSLPFTDADTDNAPILIHTQTRPSNRSDLTKISLLASTCGAVGYYYLHTSTKFDLYDQTEESINLDLIMSPSLAFGMTFTSLSLIGCTYKNIPNNRHWTMAANILFNTTASALLSSTFNLLPHIPTWTASLLAIGTSTSITSIAPKIQGLLSHNRFSLWQRAESQQQPEINQAVATVSNQPQ